MPESSSTALKANLKATIHELLETFIEDVKDHKLDHLIQSGCVDLEASSTNYIEAKLIVAAFGLELTRYYAPPSSMMSETTFKRRIQKIYQHI